MPDLPGGIVAVLMTDVVASTPAWLSAGPTATERALARLDALIHCCSSAHGGTVVKARGEGDSHFVVFRRASDALAAAAALQRQSGEEVPVTRGLVTLAELEPSAGDYRGVALNLATRFRGAAHGRQVLVTRAAADVAAPALDDGLSTVSLGVHRVRDAAEPVELLQLVGPGLVREFPPLRTLDTALTAIMAVVFLDEVHATDRVMAMDAGGFRTWARQLLTSVRSAAARADGRFVKVMGDGCVAAFEDPLRALEFAEEMTTTHPMAAAAHVGPVEVIEGELFGHTLFEAGNLLKGAQAGEIVTSPIFDAMVGRDRAVGGAAAS